MAQQSIPQGIPKKQKVPLTKRLRVYLVPALTLSIFGLIMFGLVIPKASALLGKYNEVQTAQTSVNTLQATLAQEQALDAKFASLQSHLSLINTLVPTGRTEVTAFQQKIIELAGQQGLTVLQSKTEEQFLLVDSQSSEALSIIEVPSTFTFKGSLFALKAFIQSVQSLSDFEIIGEMTLKIDANVAAIDPTITDNSNWDLTMSLVKYQFQTPDANNNLDAIYAAVSPTATPSESVMEYLDKKNLEIP